MQLKHSREFCLNLLNEYTKSDSLLKHAFAVETCVRSYAEKFDQDIELSLIHI